MDVTIPRQDLAAALETVVRAVSDHSSLPVLKNVLVDAQVGSAGGALVLSATDLELYLERGTDAQVKEAGRACVPGRQLLAYVGSLGEGDVRLTQEEGGRLRLSCGRSTCHLAGLPAEEMPTMPEVQAERRRELTVSAPLLAGALDEVLVAASKDQTRPILCGVHMKVDPGPPAALVLAATDTHRLAVSTTPLDGDGATFPPVTIPMRGAAEMLRIAAKAEGDLVLQADGNSLLLDAPGQRLFTRLVDGQYPNYQRVIPGGFTRRLRVAREALLAAVRRVEHVAKEAAVGNRVIWTVADGSLRLRAEAADVGDADEVLDGTLEGEPIELAVNAAYTVAALGHCPGDEVWLQFGEPLSPMLIVPAAGGGHQCVIMPLQMA